MDYFSRRSRNARFKKKRETKNVGGWHLNPDVENQHRYENKYFHKQFLNNSYFVLFLLNIILFPSQNISNLHLFHLQLRQFSKSWWHVQCTVNKHSTIFKRVQKKKLSSNGFVKDDYRINLTNLELQYFQKISNLFFEPFAVDVEKLALVCFLLCFIFCRIYTDSRVV